MNAAVLDASLALSWLMPGEEAQLLPGDIFSEGDSVWAPSLWPLEVCNTLAMRSGKDATFLPAALLELQSWDVQIDPETAARAPGDILSLARQHRLTVYDAAYLELALRRGAALASLDADLRRAAKTLGVQTLPAKLET
jgi:predicted nucleic acid-binding protein